MESVRSLKNFAPPSRIKKVVHAGPDAPSTISLENSHVVKIMTLKFLWEKTEKQWVGQSMYFVILMFEQGLRFEEKKDVTNSRKLN